MTNLRDPRSKNWKTLTIRLDRTTHEQLVVLARKDRRSTQNLVNLVLSDWVEDKKGWKNE